MTNSHLIGFVTFGVFALFALLAWWSSDNHPSLRKDAAARSKARRTAVFLLTFGTVFGAFAFFVDDGMRATTLHEVMVEGSVGRRVGMPAPVRIIPFTVEHPGVKHELLISPVSDVFQPPTSDVDVSFALRGPEGEVLPERTERFAVRTASRGERANWYGKEFSFTPTIAGNYVLQVKPLMTDIPRIHVRIEDPLKRDGERMSGY